MKFNSLFILVTSLFLAACSILSPVPNKPHKTFLLAGSPDPTIYHGKKAEVLLVALPKVASAYSTQKIAYSERPYQIAYFTQSQWAALPASMIQDSMVKTLNKTNRFKAVVTPPYTGPYHYTLVTDVQTLVQDFSQKTPRAKLVINVQLIKTYPSRLIAQHTFTIEKPLKAITPYDGIEATNQATQDFLSQLTRFSAHVLE